MPSTTSALSHSSNRPDHVPPLSWLRTWIVAAIVLGSSVGSLEAFWRSQGHRPSTSDSPELWAYHRKRADRSDGKAIVLLGALRMQADISVRTLERLCPGYTVAQLAASGRGSPLAVLENLCVRPAVFGHRAIRYGAAFHLADCAASVISQTSWKTIRARCEIAETVLCAMLHDSLVCSKASLSLRYAVLSPAGVQGLPRSRHICLGCTKLFLDFSSFDNLDNHRRAEYQSELAPETGVHASGSEAVWGRHASRQRFSPSGASEGAAAKWCSFHCQSAVRTLTFKTTSTPSPNTGTVSSVGSMPCA